MGKATEGDDAVRQSWQSGLKKVEERIVKIYRLHGNITRHWTAEAQRALGCVIHAPPISFGTGPKEFTEDWALIELFRNKINWDEFKGNVVYLGTF